MKTQVVLDVMGGCQADLARLLGVSPAAVSKWRGDIPQARVWQLQVIRPEWMARIRQDGMQCVVVNPPPAANDPGPVAMVADEQAASKDSPASCQAILDGSGPPAGECA